MRTEANKSLSTSAFSSSCVTKSPISREGSYFLLLFLLSPIVHIEHFGFFLDIHGQTKFYLGFNFPDLIPDCSDNFSVFLTSFLSQIPVSAERLPFSVLSLSRSYLLIPAGLLAFLTDFSSFWVPLRPFQAVSLQPTWINSSRSWSVGCTRPASHSVPPPVQCYIRNQVSLYLSEESHLLLSPALLP